MVISQTKKLTLGGLLSALVAVGTMVLVVPVPMTEGYINLGDGFIVLFAYLFGGAYAMVAGAIGSALADLLMGYAHWAPFTFIIKGLMGFAAGKIMMSDKSPLTVRNIGAVIVAEIIMVAGYLLGGTILKSSFVVALTSVPENTIQAVGAIIIFALLAKPLKRLVP